ncbi:MAG: alanine--tRNA ligase [Aggregatilineales bacterium]
MKFMTSAEVRQAFLEYFEEQRHKHVASSSLVPANDPTLLFANSGMVQFKDVFLGKEHRDYKRATTSQKSMRVSGKHNDLEEVGPSPRHHTFFEMLGNFSFGDYFKREAMEFAWQLLTQVYEFPVDRLAITIYEKDDESYDLWVNHIGIAPNRIARLGPKDNFWQMAETGPCGPNTEIHWDKFPEKGEYGIIDSLEQDDDRFLELWNLVFMQFNRTQPDPQNTGEFDEPLPAPGVDTGAGLERIVSVLQGKTANYETDLFMPIIEKTQKLARQSDEERDANIVPYRVIADHMRAAVFLIADGVLPGAKGRDSVCRLVIRRAARFGKKLGFDEPFLAEVAGAVIDVMGVYFTELGEKAETIKRTITQEEVRFHRTLDRGVGELNTMLDELPDGGELSGEKAFYLKATLGLPIQVTKDIAEERGYGVDMSGFSTAEEEHATVSGGGQAMGEIASTEAYTTQLNQLKSEGRLSEKGVDYLPYGDTEVSATVVAVLQQGEPASDLMVGDKVEIILDRTPFYAEAGGQVSDTGTISGDGWTVEVEGMAKPITGLVVHRGELVEGVPHVGDSVMASVTADRRADVTRNHTGTHLLHAALRNRLGTHVQQRGSLVAPDRLRFDFVHDAKVSNEELKQVEDEVNRIVLADYPVRYEEKSQEQARSEGAMALFGEKYGDVVRTVTIENGDRYSYELCGGVHVRSTKDIGLFIIVSEGSVSAGVRRVEALTGRAALEYVQRNLDLIGEVAGLLDTTPDNLPVRAIGIKEELSSAKRQITQLRRELARYTFNEEIQNVEEINGVPVLVMQLEDTPMDTLREMSDWFKNKVGRGVFVAGTDNDGKPQLIVSVTDDLTKSGLHAGNIIKEIAAVVGGGGGGRPNMAQAGGDDSTRLPDALAYARTIITRATS